MCAAQVKFDQFDDETRREARSALRALDALEGKGASFEVGARLAHVLRRFMQVALDSGGVAYGPIASEVTPEQAGKILGVSRPLVVQRMEDGRLPFHYVGTHRRCSLKDVLELKAKEEAQDSIMRQMYEEFDALESDHKP